MSASETTEEKIARLKAERRILAVEKRELQVDQEIKRLEKQQQQQQAVEAKKAKEVEEQEEQEVTFVGYGSLKRGREATPPKQPFKIEHGLPNVAAWDTNDKASETSPSKRPRITGSAAKSPATLAQNAIAEQSIAVPLPKRTKKPSVYDPVSDDPEYRTIIKSVTGDEYVQLACCFCGGNCSQRDPRSRDTLWTSFKGAGGLQRHIALCHRSQFNNMSEADTASRCVIHVLTPQEKKAVDEGNHYLFSVELRHAERAEAGAKVKGKKPRKSKAQDDVQV